MFNSKLMKSLPEGYNYYVSIKKKTDKIYYQYMYNKSSIYEAEILKQRIYELILNICNQEIYDYIYTFKSSDFDLISKYGIEISKVIPQFIDDIIRMKELEK